MLRTSGSDYRDYLEIMLHLLEEKKKSVEKNVGNRFNADSCDQRACKEASSPQTRVT